VSHPQQFLEHQRNATRRLNEKYPTLHKEVMARILKSNPNHQREAFAKLLEKNPDHQREAGRIGGKLGGAIVGKLTGPRTIRYALEWRKEHPREAMDILKRAQRAGNEWVREHPEEVSEFARKGGKAINQLIAAGKIKRNFGFRGKFLWHDEGSRRHFHRSLAEMSRCNELYESIGPTSLHPNLYFKGIELDWVVSKDSEEFDKDNPLTWDRVIEYHPVIRTWKGETNRQDYQNKRIEQIRNRGIPCEVLFI
jgi:general stress protein YciG